HVSGQQGDGHRGVLVGGRGGVLCDRGVVDGGDGERDGGDVGVEAAVVGFVGVGRAAGRVGVWCVAERAVAVEGQRAVGWCSDEHGGDGGTIDVDVVAEHAWGSHREGGVLVGGEAVVGGDWGVVDGIDRECHRGGGAVQLAVVGFV